jgi:L,D-transpeptidase ErfK/SrfK
MKRTVLLVLPLWLLAATASAAEYWLAAEDEVFGEVQVIAARYEDTFVSLARTYNVGFEELRRANPTVDAWLPGAGTPIVIPTQFVLPRAARRGIVVNVAELRLYYFPTSADFPPEGVDPRSQRVITHPISVGRMDWSTPIGTTSIVAKAANPSWYPPQSIREEHAARNDFLPAVVPAGPDNPLGKHALRLGLPGYLIHGTNKPSGVGMRVTQGCIRMFPEDIEALFKTVPTGTSVRIVNQPFKLGWTADGLYLEAHPPLLESNEDGENVDNSENIEAGIAFRESAMTELTRAYVAATAERHANVSWEEAERVVQLARGIPEFVSVPDTTVAATPLIAESLGAEPEASPADIGN